VCTYILRMLGAASRKVVNNHHNYAWRETHNGQNLWVVRKGATPAFPGQEGFVGGSMGDDAVILEGVDSEESRASFYSTVHGAGRIMSRSQAKKTFDPVDMDAWLARRNVLLHGGGLDESPMAYRRLTEVLSHHAGTVKINHVLRPFIVAMAGKDDRDTYKD
jgi:tRNA-splicing ligase RtcB (3'-phosphate/5'-hydroxy nucleic acid ligase)